MAKIADATFQGTSGSKYSFYVYPADTGFNAIGAVYIFSKRTVKGGVGSHTPLYIGQTENLKDRIPGHEKWECVVPLDCNCICIHSDSDEDSRLNKETDLIRKYSPPCNDQ